MPTPVRFGDSGATSAGGASSGAGAGEGAGEGAGVLGRTTGDGSRTVGSSSAGRALAESSSLAGTRRVYHAGWSAARRARSRRDPIMTLGRRFHEWRYREERIRVEVELAAALRKEQGAPAVALGEKMVALAEKSFGPDHPEAGVARYTLGAARLGVDDFAGAQREGEIALRTLPLDAVAPSRIEVLRLLASAAQRSQVAADAVARFRALATAVEALPHGEERDLELAKVDTHIALYLIELEKKDDAWSHFSRALMLYRKRLGPRDVRVGETLFNLATHRIASSSLDEAASRFEEAIAIYDAASDRVSVAACLANLAVLREEQGRDGDARTLWERALAAKQEAWGMDDYRLRPTLVRLAQVCERTGSPLIAAALYGRAYDIARVDLGEEHPITKALAEWKRSHTAG
jgi:tetratricopeptide (TPR) repeat protein